MIDELLDATRLEAQRMTLTPKAVDVAALAREVCERTANVTAGHPVLVREAGAPREAWADPARVEQVIANLVSNAAKYGAPGSEIRVDVDGSGDAVEVTVTNQGRGLAPDELPRLFQRFMRSRASVAEGTTGIGLGLYICKGLVEAHGGRMWAESTPGETTSFHFTLPAAGEPRPGQRRGEGGAGEEPRDHPASLASSSSGMSKSE
jgi:signal transduction histidine kinase